MVTGVALTAGLEPASVRLGRGLPFLGRQQENSVVDDLRVDHMLLPVGRLLTETLMDDLSTKWTPQGPARRNPAGATLVLVTNTGAEVKAR